MKQSTMPKASGVALALAAAGLLGACESTHSVQAGQTAAGTADLVHCYGVNACAGHNDCKTAENACAGKASCKGHGFVKIIADSKSGEILGVHIVGPEATEMIHEAVIAMQTRSTIRDVAAAIHSHPCLHEVINIAAREMCGKIFN